MTTRRQFLGSIPAAGAAFCRGQRSRCAHGVHLRSCRGNGGPGRALAQPVARTVTGPNGAITSRDISEVNDRLAMTEKRAIEVAPDIWLLAGWGIAHSMAVRAAEGWIIVDTGIPHAPRRRCEKSSKPQWAGGFGWAFYSRIGTTRTAPPPGRMTVPSSGATNGWTETARLARA